MKNVQYDEYQMLNRQKIAYQSFFIAIPLIIINSLINTIHIWAVPIYEGFVLAGIPLLYFITGSTYGNSKFTVQVP